MDSNDSQVVVSETADKSFLRELIEANVTRRLIPKGLSWFGCMGGLSLVAFIIQLSTGIFLMFYFIPNIRESLASIQHVSHSVPYGWLIQRMHAIGPHTMVGMVFSHTLRILFKGIYRHPRELHWVSGACLLILTLLMYYTGSLLTAHNINGHHPIHLTRIYAIHVAGIPLSMALFMGIHFFMVRKTGIFESL